jgi:choline dehydrogenase-like flavoprotein
MNMEGPKGWGLSPSTYYKGSRITSSRTYLASAPTNLTISTNNIATKILFDNSKKGTSVETDSGKKYRARKEIILSTGAIDSPRLRLLSGFGPKVELGKLSIPVIRDLLDVGKKTKISPSLHHSSPSQAT